MPLYRDNKRAVVLNDGIRESVQTTLRMVDAEQQTEPGSHFIGAKQILAFVPNDRNARGSPREDQPGPEDDQEPKRPLASLFAGGWTAVIHNAFLFQRLILLDLGQ